MDMFEPGTLWDKICAVTDRGLQRGALQPIPTVSRFVQDGRVRFLVRVVHNLARKDLAARPEKQPDGGRPNPFLPYDRELYVADASETHVCLLNKFNVVEHHLLIVTRQFEHQQTQLGLDDFAALTRCMAEFDGLGFYNSGTLAGASQPHKHLQYVPLPLTAAGPRLPVEPVLDQELPPAGAGRAGSLGFRHAAARLLRGAVGLSHREAGDLLTAYHLLLQTLGMDLPGGRQQLIATPYNLLVTRQWMMIVPRTRESFHAISFNALAFAGALLVRREEELELLANTGPLQVLRDVTQ
jgi:ATP adenylyltransferase